MYKSKLLNTLWQKYFYILIYVWVNFIKNCFFHFFYLRKKYLNNMFRGKLFVSTSKKKIKKTNKKL